jgi:hypothetical protein
VNDDPVMRIGALPARWASLNTLARRTNDPLVLPVAAR